MQDSAGQSRRLALVAAAAALALAACGSSGTGEPTSGAAATAAVQQAYGVLFDLADPAVAPKLAVVQDGASLNATISAELRSPLAKEATGATVSNVTFETGSTCTNGSLTSPCATVRYSILGTSHRTLLSNAVGYAVYVGGHWLVAKETICGLLALASGGGRAPAGC